MALVGKELQPIKTAGPAKITNQRSSGPLAPIAAANAVLTPLPPSKSARILRLYYGKSKRDRSLSETYD
jgi:hypothetical protein